MNTLLVLSTILMPLIMILIGGLYKHTLYKKINTLLDLIMPIASTFTGISDDKKEDYNKISNVIALKNKKFSLIWTLSGVSLFLLSVILLILNKADLYNTSITVLQVQCFALAAVFITVEFIMKRSLRNKEPGESNIQS